MTPVNDAPVAVNDSFTVAEDTPVTIDVRANDSDVDGDTLTVTQVNGAAITTTTPVTVTGGVVSLGADGKLTFTPTANYNGSPTFTYTVSDGHGGTATATVNGTVTPVNDAPVAVNDSFTVAEDTPVTIDVRANDSDVDGDTLTVTQINGAAITTTTPVTVTGGVVSLGADGKLTFTPTANYNGSPTFTYTVSDGHGGTATATVNGTVTPVNDAPVAVNDSFTVAEDTPVTIDVRANDSDVDGDTLAVTQINGTAITTTTPVTVTGGVVSLGADGKLTFTPTANYNGSPTFTYTVSDGHGGTATATVNGTVTPVNDAPVAVNDSFTVAEDTPVTIDVRANDSDVDGDTLAVTQINGTAITTTTPVTVTGGVVSLGADGKLTFTPTANYNGSPTFTYTVSDGHGGTATATVNGTVTPVNDAPVAVNDSFTVAEDTPVTIDVRANDSDVDGDTLTVTQVNGAAITTTTPVTVANGIVSLGADGKLTFTPNANFNGSPTFTYTVSDGHGGTSSATVNGTVTPVDDAPVNTVPTTIGAGVNTPVVIGGLAISDIDGPAGTFTTTIVVTHGILAGVAVAGGAAIAGSGTSSITFTGTLAQVNAALGAVTFTGAPGFTGTASAVVTTSDGTLTDTDNFNITVSAIQNGVAQDGYIEGARVYYDTNGNHSYDAGEPTTFTDATGHFSLALPPGAAGNIYVTGGTNVDTGLPNVVDLKAPIGSTVINPLTSMVADLIDSGQTPAEANAHVAASLGLPAGLDFGSYDFLDSAADPATSLAIQKSAAQIAQLVTNAVNAGLDPAAVLSAISNSSAAGASVDLTNASELTTLLTDAGADPTVAQGLGNDTASVNQAIDAATSAGDVSTVQHDYNQPGANLPPQRGRRSLYASTKTARSISTRWRTTSIPKAAR